MSYIVLFFILAAMLGFLVLTAVKAWRYTRYPIHSRLELYPVPKEGKGRAEYGGSYFEEPEWWKKPRAINKINETKDILKEMIFIRKLFVYQKSLWWASWMFHMGIYALLVWTILLLLASIWPVQALIILAGIAGVIGFALATVGALLLLGRRIFDTDLRLYTTPAEYFNLILILFVLVTGIICWTMIASPFAVAGDLLSFKATALPPLVIIHFFALGIMLIYIPVSKMSHYVGKFFSFHKVLWDNDPNHKNSQVNLRLRQAAAKRQQVSWDAPHIKGEEPVLLSPKGDQRTGLPSQEQ